MSKTKKDTREKITQPRDDYELPDDVSDSLQEYIDDRNKTRKIAISIRVDDDLLAYFKSLGPRGYQTWMHQALRQWAESRKHGGKIR